MPFSSQYLGSWILLPWLAQEAGLLHTKLRSSNLQSCDLLQQTQVVEIHPQHPGLADHYNLEHNEEMVSEAL